MKALQLELSDVEEAVLLELSRHDRVPVTPKRFRPAELSSRSFYGAIRRLGRRGLIESSPIAREVLRGGQYRKRVYRIGSQIRIRTVFEIFQ